MTATTKSAADEGPLGQGTVGEVAQRVGPEQDQRGDLRPARLLGGLAGQAARMPAVSRPAASGTRPRRRRTTPARRRGRPGRAGARGPGPCRARRGRCPGAGRAGRWPGAGAGQHAGGLGDHLARLGEGGPAEHHHHTVAVGACGQRRPGRGQGALAHGRPLGMGGQRRRRRRVAAEGPGHDRRVAGSDGQRGGGVRGERGGRGRQLDQAGRAGHRVAQAQEEDRQLLADVAGQVNRTGAAQASSMVARGRPSTSSAGRPSPSWASTESVPMTPLASLAQAYALVGQAGAADQATAPGPPASRAAPSPAAAAASASPQLTATSSPSLRTSGSIRRPCSKRRSRAPRRGTGPGWRPG